MTIKKLSDRIIINGTKDFDIGKTLECGQLFRYKKIGNNHYSLCSSDKICVLKTENGSVIIETGDIEYFYNYFDLETDYNNIFNSLEKFEELHEALEEGRGIRILKQDLFETIISFIISANNNIPRIKGIIERLCANFGENRGSFNAFITKERYKNITKEELGIIGAGFRADYLYRNKDLLSKESYLNMLKSLSRKDAAAKLKELAGVGDKVAACVSLFGLNHTGSYPVDTWIFKANKTDKLDTAAKVQEHFESRYGPFAGYAQQFIFYYKRNLRK